MFRRSVLLTLGLFTLCSVSSGAFAAEVPVNPSIPQQTLRDAMAQNTRLFNMVYAITDAAAVECVLTETSRSRARTGPESRMAVTHQSACFDPLAFNPDQLGQLFVTYYGTGQSATSPVEEVIQVEFTVFK